MKKNALTIVRKSCITGKIVWIYRGASKNAARVAYLRACRHELERVKRWAELLALRKSRIMQVLVDCTDSMPIAKDLPAEKRMAARQILDVSRDEEECHSDFYNHIIEERRRHNEDKKIRECQK